jgi:PKD repeat protein
MNMFTARVRLSGALVATCLIGGGLLLAAPAAAADSVPAYDCVVEAPFVGAPAEFQPIRVCASFDKASYSSGDVVRLTVSATNVGTATAPGVSMWSTGISGSDHWDRLPDGALLDNRIGPDLPAGATLVSEVDGYAADPASGAVTFSGSVIQFLPDGSGSTYGDPVSISSAVTPATGDYSGSAFVDGNNNGRPDAGEGLAGAQVTLTGPYSGINGNPEQSYTATSDAQGDFGLTGLPAGHYSVEATGPSGWYVRPGDGEAIVDGSSGTTPDLFPATPTPFPLRASASFDKASYRAGDTAQITVNLTNTSASDLHGIQAQCNPGGGGTVMWGEGAGWDVLQAPGVTVSAKQTTTLHLSEVVPADAVNTVTGDVSLDCLFGPNPGYELTGVAEARASATVSAPADPVDFTAEFASDDPLGSPVICDFDLLNPATQDPLVHRHGGAGPVVNLPAGTYDIAIPSNGDCHWKLAPGQSNVLNTADITNGQTVDIHVVRTAPLAPPRQPLAPVLSVDQGNPENPMQVEASGLKSTDAGQVDSYSFDFGDGTDPTANGSGLTTHTYAKAGAYTVTLTDHDTDGNTASTTRQVVIGSPFVPLSPHRLLDTRNGTGAAEAKVGPGGQVSLAVTGGQGGIPADGVTAVVLNVTVTNSTDGGFLTVYPDGTDRPSTSNLNFTAGETIPNLVTVPVGADGKVNFYNHFGSVDVVADVEGYYRTAANPESGNQYQAGYLVGQAPQRLLDTRNGTGASAAPLAAGAPLSVDVLSAPGVPKNTPIRAVVLNVTATGSTKGGDLTVYPDGSGGAPNASNLNFTAGETIANSVIVPVPADGDIRFLNLAGAVDVVADVQGYYVDGPGGAFVPVGPTRLLDTRSGGGGALGQNGVRALQVGGSAGVPGDASAAVLNVTVADSTAGGYLTVYPDGSAVPNASNINFLAGETIPNMVTVGIGGDGKVDFDNHFGSVDVVADLFGYFTGS